MTTLALPLRPLSSTYRHQTSTHLGFELLYLLLNLLHVFSVLQTFVKNTVCTCDQVQG